MNKKDFELQTVSNRIKDNQSTIFDDFKVKQIKCERCESLNLKVFWVENCIWEIWAKCDNCDHIFCIQTE